MQLAVAPAGIVAVIATAVVTYVLAVRGSGDLTYAGQDDTVWLVLALALLLICAVLVTAARFASSRARSTLRLYSTLRQTAQQSRTDMGRLLTLLRQGEQPLVPRRAPLQEPTGGGALDVLAYEQICAQRVAEDAVAEAVALVQARSSGTDKQVKVLLNLARRLQSLVHRQIGLLDKLEGEVEEPDVLKGIFQIDHLATLVRRYGENLAVLGGAGPRRRWTHPVSMVDVLRSAIAETENYRRVRLVPPVENAVHGHAVADVIHLIAELVENATNFSPPETRVELRAQLVRTGLAIEVEDRGLGMSPDQRGHFNELLADPEEFDVSELVSEVGIGLYVVSTLARRHGIAVQLQHNMFGGTTAWLVLPHQLLGEGTDHNGPAAGAAALPRESGQQAPGTDGDKPQFRAHAEHRPDPTASSPQARPAQHPRPTAGSMPEAESPVPQNAATSLSAPASSDQGGSTGGRPTLPKRRPQHHLVDELLDAPPSSDSQQPGALDDQNVEHDPGLMAAFQRGSSLADEADADRTRR